MRRTMFLLCAIALLAAVSCTKWKSVDGGLVVLHDDDAAKVTKTFKVGGFEKIEMTGSVDVKYVQGDVPSVEAKGSKELIDRLDVTSDGTTLYVKYKENHGINIFSGSYSAVVYVTSPDIIAVTVTGSGDFSSEGLVDTDDMAIKLKGSGDVNFDNMICNTLDVSVYGSGDVDIDKVKAAKTSLAVKGSGDISVDFDDSGTVESHIYGSGDISLKGKVRSEKHSVKGSGDVDTDGLKH